MTKRHLGLKISLRRPPNLQQRISKPHTNAVYRSLTLFSLFLWDVLSVRQVYFRLAPMGRIERCAQRIKRSKNMQNSPYVRKLKIGEAATYRIEVQGRLDENWSGRLGGMRIALSSEAGGSSVTTLSGRVRDQAALMGVLNSLYELHLPILSVEIMGEQPTETHVPESSNGVSERLRGT